MRCNNPLLTLVANGECNNQQQNCPGVCTFEYNPVCGSDGNTYGNLCQLVAERRCKNPNLRLISRGECGSQQNQCPGVCPANYDPVCGSDGVTYGNLCHLESEKRCKNPLLTQVSTGVCSSPLPCPGACSKEYKPVCGSDGQTYGNRCTFEAQRRCNNPLLIIVNQGECVVGQCGNACATTFNPVCGSDGVTYTNLCLFEAQRCKNPHLILASRGSCATLPPHGGQCSLQCTLQYDPVCGSDGTTYGNLCLLTAEQTCNNPQLRFVRRGACEVSPSTDCPGLCTLEYNPVCGSDGVTYGNLCQLKLMKCRNTSLSLAYRGQCRVVLEQCPVMCPSRYNPVCGTDGRTYANSCVLSKFACRGKRVRVKQFGKCR